VKSFEATSTPRVDSSQIQGDHRPEKPGEDRMEEMYAGTGMSPPPKRSATIGPGQCTSYNVPVRKWKNDHKR
jgi:hypothetical protein